MSPFCKAAANNGYQIKGKYFFPAVSGSWYCYRGDAAATLFLNVHHLFSCDLHFSTWGLTCEFLFMQVSAQSHCVDSHPPFSFKL